MLRTLLFGAMLSTLLAGPALADSASLFQLKLDVDSGGHARRYTLKLVDEQCGHVIAKNTNQEDNIKICAHVDPKSNGDVRFDVGWWVRDGDREQRTDSSVVLAHGGWVEFDSPAAKLTVALQ